MERRDKSVLILNKVDYKTKRYLMSLARNFPVVKVKFFKKFSDQYVKLYLDSNSMEMFLYWNVPNGTFSISEENDIIVKKVK